MKRYDLTSKCGCIVDEDEWDDGKWTKAEDGARILAQRDRLMDYLGYIVESEEMGGGPSTEDIREFYDQMKVELDKEKQS